MQYIVIGIDAKTSGLKFWGPFRTAAHADEWSKENQPCGGLCWRAELHQSDVKFDEVPEDYKDDPSWGTF
jgi:hypothetical protein